MTPDDQNIVRLTHLREERLHAVRVLLPLLAATAPVTTRGLRVSVVLFALLHDAIHHPIERSRRRLPEKYDRVGEASCENALFREEPIRSSMFRFRFRFMLILVLMFILMFTHSDIHIHIHIHIDIHIHVHVE